MISRPRALLLDATTYLYRAYFARRSLVGRDGSQVNALYGFIETLLALLEEWQPEYAAAAFDDPTTATFRDRLFPAYKQSRPSTPERLLPQFALAMEATRMLGVTPFQVSGYEAEDLLATLVRRLTAQDVACLVVGTDKDLAQLVRPGVWLYPLAQAPVPGGAGLRPASRSGPEARAPRDAIPNSAPPHGLAHPEPMDAAAVKQRYGVRPEQIPDLLALGGDPIDGLPGVPGIGKRLARRLLDTSIPLETLRTDPAALESLVLPEAPRVAATLQEGWDAYQHGRRLATLRDDVPLAVSEAPIRRQAIDPAEVRSYCDHFGFDRLRDRILASAVDGVGMAAESKVDTDNLEDDA